MQELSRVALRQKQLREQECAHINSMKIHNQWRKIMRVSKVDELRGEVEILSQNHEREVDRKDALVQVCAAESSARVQMSPNKLALQQRVTRTNKEHCSSSCHSSRPTCCAAPIQRHSKQWQLPSSPWQTQPPGSNGMVAKTPLTYWTLAVVAAAVVRP